ncbi:CueP family metal-binding protein [Mumia quercus]|uniref:CueP family metal-binding protein n=1 Tax=Mumia quercus TaxID=2976125 RepID=UPI0021CF3637|nr:CueP family metal-binding protein [Mumia quercus]
MRVRVEDRAAGTTLVDETLTTHDNGFVGLWLPRDVDATLSVEVDGRTTSAPLSTTSADLTCVTTLRLV